MVDKQSMEIKQKVEKNRKNIQHTFQVHYAKFQVEARIYNGEKTVSSASGVGKAGQPHVNQ